MIRYRLLLLGFILFFLAFSLSGCNNKEQLLEIQSQLSERFEYSNKIKELDKREPQTYQKIRNQLDRVKEDIALSQYEDAENRLKLIADALKKFNIHIAVDHYYIDAGLEYMTTGNKTLDTIESTTKKLAINNIVVVGKTKKSEINIDDIDRIMDNQKSTGKEINSSHLTENENEATKNKESTANELLPTENRISITYEEINILDNIAKAVEELCPHVTLMKIALLKDSRGKYIYLLTAGSNTFNSRLTNPLVRASSYLKDDFGRLFTKVPSIYQGYIIDMLSGFQDFTAEEQRTQLFQYWNDLYSGCGNPFSAVYYWGKREEYKIVMAK